MMVRRVLLAAAVAGGGGFVLPGVHPQPRVVHEDDDTYKGAGVPALDGDGVFYRAWSVVDSHGGPNGDLYFQYSDDDLATWSTPVQTVTHASGHHLSEGWLLATSSGRLVWAYNDILDSNLYDVRIKVIYSDNAGSTWSSPYIVSDSGSLTGEQAVSDIIELPGGDLLMGAFGDNSTDGNYISGTYLSTDDGATWGSWNLISSAHNPAEPDLVILSNGDIRAYMRSDGDLKMYACTSTDDGATWGASVDCGALRGRPAVEEILPGLFFWLGRSDNGPNFYRRWATSTDGLTFTTPAVLDSGETRRGEDANLLKIESGRVLCFDAYEDTSTATTVYIREFTATE